jgi:aspartyl-tRNA(Asn)/glutamyl-tRNA(Gln) amidotransferase subunit B
MAEPYTIVVGLEVHVQLLTRTKLFCGCRNQFGLPPNSDTCPVCLGLPGSLPVMNRQAFQLALRAALALNCQIAAFTKWDRKNYYYPDLPKNYQISQYDLPFSHDGFLEINIHPDPKKGYTPKRVGIIRAHLEEDAGKSVHDESGRGGETRVDLNRTGTPLVEIVSQPHINAPEEAIAYLEEIRLMMRELGVSDCEMQEGSLRCDANVNIHIADANEPSGYVATPLVEIKNLNSFRAVGRAITYEAKRQYEAFQRDPANYRIDRVRKATAGWDDARGRTEVQRHKEEAADYRYFPDPDLVPVTVSREQLDAVRAAMGELPSQQRQRLQTQYGLSPYAASVLTAKGRPTVAYFEEVAAVVGDGKLSADRISDLIFPALTTRLEEIADFPIRPAAFADFLKKTAPIGQDPRRKAFEYMLERGADAAAAMATLGIRTDFDEATLRGAVRAAIAANPKAAEDYKKGKAAAANKIKGDVMRANKGAPNDVVQRLMEEELAKV